DRAVVCEDPASASERMRVLDGDGADRALADVRDQNLAAHIFHDLLESRVSLGLGGLLVNRPRTPFVMDRDTPSIRVLAGEKAQVPRSLAQAQAEVAGPASYDTKKTAHYGPREQNPDRPQDYAAGRGGDAPPHGRSSR